MNSRSSLTPLSTRRRFLAQCALAGAVVPLARLAGAERPATGGPVIHVFSKPLHWLSHAEAARLIASAGYGGIDYTVRVAQGHVLPAKVQEDLPRAIEAAHKEGLKVEMITTEITSVRDPHAETLLRTAAKHGVKCYRLGNWNYDAKLSVPDNLARLKPAFRELAAFNASLGLHGAIQNHAGTRVGSAVWDLYELLRDIDPRGLGVQYDIRHAVAEGGQSWPVGLKLLAPWIKCTDLKDFRWEQTPGKAVIDNVPIGRGIVPFDAYFKLVRELKLTGPMSVHLEYAPFERSPMPEAEKRVQFPKLMRQDLEALRGFMTKQGVG